jgi:hypothetical protein
MSTPWDKLYAAANAAYRRGDYETASGLAYAAREAEQAAERTAAAQTRRAGSNAFRSDAEEAILREENQRRFSGDGRGR